MTVGYSGRSLAAKLGFKPGMTVQAIDPPGDYDALTGALEAGVLLDAEGPFGLVHLFVRDRTGLEAAIAPALDRTAEGGMVWISWPKKASPLFRDLTEDGIRAVVLPTGWVDVKVCAVDADWSGLKFLRRRR